MNTNEMNPVFMLRGYIRALLVQELSLSSTTPIASADGPEWRADGDPYLVYAFNEEPHGDLVPYRKGVVTFAVYAKTSTEVNNIIQVLSRALNTDQSPQWIMDWSHRLSTPFAGTNISYTGVYGSESAMPASDEGGYVAGMIEIGYRYTVADQDFSIRP